jgi:WD40 repeat protein
MNPIYKTQILQGHSRPIKDIKFSKDGKYIFSASSDRLVLKWDSITNEKIITYVHQASVNVICISQDNKWMFTGDSTGCIYIWNLNTNELFKKVEFDAILNIRSIDISTDDLYIIVTLGSRAKNSKSFVNSYLTKDFLNEDSKDDKNVPKEYKIFICQNQETKFVKSLFTNFNKSILVSREDGQLEMINFENNLLISSEKFHNDIILDFDVNYENGLIITSSKDTYLCLINLNTFQLVRKFQPINPTRNLNACKIAIIDNPYYRIPGINNGVISVDNLFDLNEDINTLIENENFLNVDTSKFGKSKKIILAIVSGGQDSKFVTTTNQKEGGFDIIMYNAMNGEELASFLDHFGPVNTLAICGNVLASGAEDATVRIHKIEYYLFPK